MANVITALRERVSWLRENIHEQLNREILQVRLWEVPEVNVPCLLDKYQPKLFCASFG
jgi:hypothetical protein